MDYSKVFEALRSGQGTFVYGLLSKWYLFIALPSMTITYKVLKALQDRGVLDMIQKEIKNAFDAIEIVANECPQHIVDLEIFFRCLGF